MQYDSYSQEETHMVQAIVGANWGDEGKGKITDMLAEKADIIVRFQGGANAGHTIVNNYGKFALHTLPSGVFYSHTTSIIGNGVALDIPVLINELNSIVERGVPMPKLLISDRAQIVMPYHILFDKYEEERLAGKSFGSTKSGIAPFYSDKYAKIGFQVNELFDEERLLGKLKDVCEKKNVMLEHLYHKPLLVPEEILETLKEYREMVKPFVCNTSLYLWNALKEGKTVLLEGQLGTLKDPDHGIYPMVTSSSTLAAYGAIGAGLPPYEITKIVTVCKAYSSAVGAGAFVSEIFGEEADELRKRGGDGGEFGATTGRPRRMGWFDCVASKYGCRMQGATDVAFTVLDVLGYLEATEDLISKGYKDVIDRFNEEYDGKYHVTPITTNLEEYDGKLNALIAAGQTPDVYICNPGPNMDVYVNAGAAADLTDILENQEADWYASFTDGIFERMTYDGKIMAVPTNFAAACVYYNTEMFADAGVEVPTTYDELIAACQKLQDAGYTPISCSAGTAWCLSMIAGYLCDRQGVDLAAIADHTANWTDENCIEAGTKLKDLSQYFQATAAGDSNDQATAAFYNGEAAMLVQGSWAIAQINGNNPDFESKCGVFQFPGIDGANDPNRMIVKTDNLLMSSTTEHQDAAIALMKMFTDETAQKYTAEIGGKFPIIKDLEIDYDKAPAQLKYVQDIMAKATGTFGFYNESLASVEAGDCFDNAMVDIFLGNQTPEEAFQTVQTFYEENVWE